ncbi:MAG: polyprenyl synthetase family protein [Muribaculaceae bacterium]|nr:polyprenyl synthetase family protein [Muribaculaceae bacterium]
MILTEKISELITEWFANISYPSEPSGLFDPIEYTLRSGGKRLRPALLLAAVNAFGGDMQSVRNQCIGIEMFHNFTLLHDDVMDNSDVRRGQPTVHRKWNENTAILSGDTMLTLATQYICDCPDNKIRQILDTFNTTALEVYCGQQYDMDFENRSDVSVEEYIEMIRLKTSVLLGCALKIGAIMSGADSKSTDAIYNFGVNLGLGFQLRDDYLDTFGDPLIFGKHLGGDILNDKKTWLMIMASNEDTSGVMEKALQGRYEENEKISKVTETYRILQLDKRILELISHYSNLAVRELESLQISSDSKRYFIELIDTLETRMI